jgi:hypothetical protein
VRRGGHGGRDECAGRGRGSRELGLSHHGERNASGKQCDADAARSFNTKEGDMPGAMEKRAKNCGDAAARSAFGSDRP